MKQSEIEKMSVDEKLQAMEALWSALDDGDVDAPEWHQSILKKRIQELESGQVECIPLDVLKRRKLHG